MTSMTHPASQNSTATPPTQVGSTVAALLERVPEPLRTSLAGAIAADQIRTYGIGLHHAAANAFKAIEAELANTRQPCRSWCASHVQTIADGDICHGETIRLDFRTPNRPVGHSDGASLGLSYADDEGDSAFVDLGEGPQYMTVGDLRALATAALKLTDTAGGAR